MTEQERLRYLTNGELREEIVYAVGGDPDRYGPGSDHMLIKDDLVRIATDVLADNNDEPLSEYSVEELYDLICTAVGTEFEANAGRAWGLKRRDLKAIHRVVDGQDPRQDPLVVSGGESQC